VDYGENTEGTEKIATKTPRHEGTRHKTPDTRQKTNSATNSFDKLRTGSQVLEERQTSKAVLLSKFSQKLSRKQKFLNIQGNFGEIIDVVRRKLCFLNV
jgi:hypothetical protein